MAYDIANDPYIDPSTGILHNKLGAKTQAKLDKAEAEITYIVITTLTYGSRIDSLVFDSTLLCDIHREIFRDLYSWAGKIRTHDISKERSYFAHAVYIQDNLTNLLTELASDNIIGTGNLEVFTDRLTHYYAELNAIHPFREGNGRTIRTFLRLLALKHGYDIEWRHMDEKENVQASREALHTTNTQLRAVLRRLIVKLD